MREVCVLAVGVSACAPPEGAMEVIPACAWGGHTRDCRELGDEPRERRTATSNAEPNRHVCRWCRERAVQHRARQGGRRLRQAIMRAAAQRGNLWVRGCRHLVHALARVSRGCFVVGLGCSVGCLVYTLGCKFSKKNNWAAKRATELDRAETGSARSPNESNIHSSARPISMSGRAESGQAGASFGPS